MADPSLAKLGIKAATFLNGASFNTPTWAEITAIENWTVNPGWENATIKSRATRMVLNAKTMLAMEVSGRLLASDTDTQYQTIIGALVNDDTLDIMVLNGSSTTNGVRGFRFEAQVHGGSEDQGTDVVVYDEVSFMPAFTTNPPQSVVVTNNVPVFTTLAAN